MSSRAAVEILGQTGHSLRGIAHHHLRRPEHITRPERIRKQLIRKTKLHADIVILILFNLALEASGIDETHTVAVSVIFRCHVINQQHGRAVLMAGRSSGRADRHRAMADPLALGIALHTVASVKGDSVKVAGHKVQARALRLFQGKCALSIVFNANSPGDNVKLRQNTVVQVNLQLQKLILQSNDKRLRICTRILIRIVRINRRKAGDAVQSVFDTPGIIAQITVQRPVLIRDLQLNTTVVTVAQIRILLRQEIHRIGSIRLRLIRIAGKSAVLERQQEMHIPCALAAIVLMQQITVTVHVHLVSRAFRVQCEDESVFVNLYSHGNLHSAAAKAQQINSD